jgi:hypothetical protein
VIATVKEVESRKGDRKVETYRRDDGTFGFEDLGWILPEKAWIPVGRYSLCFVDSELAAESEARERIKWLATK